MFKQTRHSGAKVFLKGHLLRSAKSLGRKSKYQFKSFMKILSSSMEPGDFHRPKQFYSENCNINYISASPINKILGRGKNLMVLDDQMELWSVHDSHTAPALEDKQEQHQFLPQLIFSVHTSSCYNFFFCRIMTVYHLHCE